MSRLKTLGKYAIWVIAFFIFSTLISYIGLNARYKNIEPIGEIPGGVKINLSQATKVNGRIFGEVTSTEGNDLNGKYLRVDIFSKNDNFAGTKYLKLDDLTINEPRKFAVYFSAENIEHYTIDILDYSEQLKDEEIRIRNLYKEVFIDEDLKTTAIIALLLFAMFA